MVSIHQLKHSPFCIPIVAIFRALDIPLREIEVPNGNRSAIIKLTKGAYYQVPVLVDGSQVIYESAPDSQDVARYIDAKFAGGRLFPKTVEGFQSIVISYLENDVENVTFRLTDPKYIASISDVVERTAIIRHKERKFGVGCVARWKKEAPQLRRQAADVLAPFDKIFQNSPFLFGGEPVYADFLLFGILGNLTYRDFNPLPPKLKALRAWEKSMRTWRFS